MGKQGALNAWLREFCSLVFTQTLQAFIYAIIITLIMAGLNYTNEYSQTEIINKTSVGIINIFALTSIFKIEEMARKIFGLQRSGFQNESPMQSMAKLAFISHFGRRLWDNGKKMIKGGSGYVRGIRQKRKERVKTEESLSPKAKKHKEIRDQLAAIDRQIEAENRAHEAGETVTPQVVNGTSTINATGEAGDGTLTVASLTINANSVNMNGAGGNGPQSLAEKKQKLEEKRDALEDAMQELRKNRDDKIDAANKQMVDSVHMALSGAAESMGAILGGALGAVVGAADGKDVAKGVVVGMNLGDRVGQGAADAGFAVKEAIDDFKKDLKVKAKLDDSEYQKNVKIVNSYIDSVLENRKERDKVLRDALERAQNEIDEDTERIRNELNNMP